MVIIELGTEIELAKIVPSAKDAEDQKNFLFPVENESGICEDSFVADGTKKLDSLTYTLKEHITDAENWNWVEFSFDYKKGHYYGSAILARKTGHVSVFDVKKSGAVRGVTNRYAKSVKAALLDALADAGEAHGKDFA